MKYHVGIKIAKENERVLNEYMKASRNKSALKTIGDYNDEVEKNSKTTKNTLNSTFYLCSSQHETHNSE